MTQKRAALLLFSVESTTSFVAVFRHILGIKSQSCKRKSVNVDENEARARYVVDQRRVFYSFFASPYLTSVLEVERTICIVFPPKTFRRVLNQNTQQN